MRFSAICIRTARDAAGGYVTWLLLLGFVTFDLAMILADFSGHADHPVDEIIILPLLTLLLLASGFVTGVKLLDKFRGPRA